MNHPLDTEVYLQVSIIPLQNGYDLNADVEEIDLDRSEWVYDAPGNPMTCICAVRLTVQVASGRGIGSGLLVMTGSDDVIVLGTNALKI